MFARPVVTFDPTVLERRTDRLLNIVPYLNDQVELNLIPASQARTDATINAEPGPHRRPTDWQTPKQRAWWFAIGINLWHGRTGAVRQWKIILVRTPDGGQIVATNPTAYWPFVYGTLANPLTQQRMHMGTWQSLTSYQQAERAALEPELRSAFSLIVGRNP